MLSRYGDDVGEFFFLLLGSFLDMFSILRFNPLNRGILFLTTDSLDVFTKLMPGFNPLNEGSTSEITGSV